MAATKRKPAAKQPPRRTPEFVRPYLTKAEATAVLDLIHAAPVPLSGDVQNVETELTRWLAV